MDNITINILSKCNAKCGHCCFSCSPNSTDKLEEEEIWNILNYAIANDEIKEIALTGGEIFLKEKLVCDIIKKVSAAGKVVTCISNGFWGRTPEKAKQKLEKFCALGLRHLSLSYDDFHAKYVKIECIENILNAAVQLPIQIKLNMTVTKENDGIWILDRLKNSLLGVAITRFSAAPVGEAKNIPEKHLYHKLNSNLTMKCSEPNSGLVINHDGYVLPCCSPLVIDSFLKIGNIRNDDIANLEKKMYSNVLMYIIKKEGLNWFVEKLEKRGIFSFSDKWYTSSCELCRDLFINDEVVKILYEDIRQYHEEYLSKIRK